jgi:hypothetical protein
MRPQPVVWDTPKVICNRVRAPHLRKRMQSEKYRALFLLNDKLVRLLTGAYKLKKILLSPHFYGLVPPMVMVPNAIYRSERCGYRVDFVSCYSSNVNVLRNDFEEI